MEIIDTQILSFGFKDKMTLEAERYSISSITASEFLLIYSHDPQNANYYIPHPNRYKYKHLNNEEIKTLEIPSLTHPAGAKRARQRTDTYEIEFKKDFPKLIEFGSQALSILINEKMLWLYDQVIQTMPKDKQKYLRKRIKYIISKEINCIPINSRIIEISFDILESFLKQNNPKENFRNTYNDILILSTAIESKMQLITKDKLLNELSSEIYGGTITKTSNLVKIDFSEKHDAYRKSNNEAKGYINKGWQYKERKPIII